MSAYRDLGRPADVLECDGEEFEDFCIEVGSAEGDRLMLAQAARLTCGYDK
jgi:hypothetical protein